MSPFQVGQPSGRAEMGCSLQRSHDLNLTCPLSHCWPESLTHVICLPPVDMSVCDPCKTYPQVWPHHPGLETAHSHGCGAFATFLQAPSSVLRISRLLACICTTIMEITGLDLLLTEFQKAQPQPLRSLLNSSTH